jgi:hypothetical protein
VFSRETIRCPHCGGKVKKPHFPVLDNATNTIHALRVVPHSEYMRLALEDRRNAFSVTGIESVDTLMKVKGIVAECFVKGEEQEDFERKLKRAFGKTLVLTDACLEKVFRGTFNKAYLDGLLKTLEHPVVASGFPYLEILPIADDRTPASHLALERFGLNGTGVYRRDDPFWRKFMPPLTDLCRCGLNQQSIRTAAEKGVREAQEWLRTGQPPERPEWVKPPAFDPRLELEDEADEWADCGETPREILKTVRALRARLIKDMDTAPSAPSGRRLPRCVLRAPRTTEEGLALLQGRIEAVFTLPPLDGYLADMERVGMENIPSWKGELESDREYLDALDAIIGCCRQAAGQG